MKNGIILMAGMISAFLMGPLSAAYAHESVAHGHFLLLSERNLNLTLNQPSFELGDAGGIAAALGGFVARGALGPSARSLPKEQIGPGLLLAGVVFFAGFKLWDDLRIWSASIPLDLQATDMAGLILPARRPFYGMPNVSTTSALGIELNW